MMVDDLPEFQISDDLDRRIKEAKQKSFEEELQRLALELSRRAQEAVAAFRTKEEEEFQAKVREIQAERQREEDKVNRLEETFRQHVLEELRIKAETRRREEEEIRRKEEEEQRRREEITRLQAEEENRRRQEEEDRRIIEEEIRHKQEERRQREEELRHQDKERAERIRELLKNANEYYTAGNYELALVEVAKALVNDPHNVEALELETKIKEVQVEFAPVIVDVAATEPKQKKQKHPVSVTSAANPKKKLPLPVMLGIITIIIAVSIIVVIQITKRVFNYPLTVAVIPWTSTSNNLQDNILGSSLAEEVTNKFASISTMPVLGYASSYNVTRHTAISYPGIFRLGFSYILEGELSRAGEEIRVNLKLTDSLDNVVWTRQIIKPASGLADLPGEISEQLLDALDINIQGNDWKSKLSRTNRNPDAYLFYLRGLELLHRRTPESLTNAYELFLQAVQQDSKFAEGLAAAANVLASKLEAGLNRGDSSIIRAIHLAEAAITANPRFDGGYYALGRILAYDKNYNQALINFDSALTLSPNNAYCFLEKGKIFTKVGKYADAFEAFAKAYRLNPCEPELLQTYANAYQLIRVPSKAMPYHELAITNTDDSLSYVVGPVSDAIIVDPDLRLSQSNRVLSACVQRARIDPKDYIALYRFARLKQLMGHIDADNIFTKLETLLLDEIRQDPKNAITLAYYALTLTRLGRFTESMAIAERANSINPTNAEVKYKIAQMYSIQMYSRKEKQFDERKKAESLRFLKEAIALNYRIDELVNADFYNMLDRSEFRTIIQEPLR